MTAKRAAVTGAGGFVGGPTVLALAKAGYATTAIVRRQSAVAAAQRVIVAGDLDVHTDWTPLIAGSDVVVHLAGRAHTMEGEGPRKEALYRAANVGVTIGLAEACLRLGVRRLVFVSSIKVNGERTFGVPFAAADPPAPRDAYGRSKAEAEACLRTFSAKGLEVVILRPPLMYGRGVRGNLTRLLGWVERGIPLPLASIANRRDLLSVDAFAELIALAAAHPRAVGRVFLARDGRPASTPDLIRAMAAALGRPARLLPSPPSLLEGAASLAGYGAEAARLVGDLEIDDRESREILGWRPNVDMVAELARAAAWQRERRAADRSIAIIGASSPLS